MPEPRSSETAAHPAGRQVLCSPPVFADRLGKALVQAGRRRAQVAVLVFRLPSSVSPCQVRQLEIALFRQIRRGGLTFLRAPWRREGMSVLTTRLHQSDIPARISAAVLAVALPNTGGDAAAVVGSRLTECLSDAAGVQITYGMAVYPQDGQTVADLIRVANRSGQR